MNLAIIGTGHVGLVSGACLAEMGNHVICVDNDLQKLAALREGHVPIYEPGLQELVSKNRQAGRIHFTESVAQGVQDAEVIFITVGTPSNTDGSANLRYVEAVSREIAQAMPGYRLVVEKSTVPANTGEWIKRTLRLYSKNGADFDVASVPEFLREGAAIEDFLKPHRIVIGTETQRAEATLRHLFQPLGAPIIAVDIKTAELIKHACNSFLALKISYINAIANICERVGADVVKVAQAMGLDPRIGPAFLQAGIGYGGSCLPKDVAAFASLASQLGYDFGLLHEVAKINSGQALATVSKLRDLLWILEDKTIGILGLAYKPRTDDVRDAPSLQLISSLLQERVRVKVYDPAAMANARQVLGDGVTYSRDPYDLAEGCHGLVMVTEWPQFKELDLKRLKGLMALPVFVDGRNLFDPVQMAALGFDYRGVGR